MAEHYLLNAQDRAAICEIARLFDTFPKGGSKAEASALMEALIPYAQDIERWAKSSKAFLLILQTGRLAEDGESQGAIEGNFFLTAAGEPLPRENWAWYCGIPEARSNGRTTYNITAPLNPDGTAHRLLMAAVEKAPTIGAAEITEDIIQAIKAELELPDDLVFIGAEDNTLIGNLAQRIKALRKLSFFDREEKRYYAEKEKAEKKEAAATLPQPIQKQYLTRHHAQRIMWSGCLTYSKTPGEPAQLDLMLPDEPLPTIFRKRGGKGTIFRLRFNELAKDERLAKLQRLNPKERYYFEWACSFILEAHPEIINEIRNGKPIEKLIREDRPTIVSYSKMLRNMGYRSNSSPGQKKALRNIFWKLNDGIIEWIELNENDGSTYIHAEKPRLLETAIDEKWTNDNRKLDEGYITFLRIPLCLAHGIQTSLWEEMEANVMGCLPYNKNENTLKLTYYLLDSVEDMKNPNPKTRRSNHIRIKALLDTMMKGKTYANPRKEKERWLGYMTDCLDHLKDTGLLTAWRWLDKSAPDMGYLEIDVLDLIPKPKGKRKAIDEGGKK